jgi:hypothetical protein
MLTSARIRGRFESGSNIVQKTNAASRPPPGPYEGCACEIIPGRLWSRSRSPVFAGDHPKAVMLDLV